GDPEIAMDDYGCAPQEACHVVPSPKIRRANLCGNVTCGYRSDKAPSMGEIQRPSTPQTCTWTAVSRQEQYRQLHSKSCFSPVQVSPGASQQLPAHLIAKFCPTCRLLLVCRSAEKAQR